MFLLVSATDEGKKRLLYKNLVMKYKLLKKLLTHLSCPLLLLFLFCQGLVPSIASAKQETYLELKKEEKSSELLINC
jgi:hypothetical protein